MGNDGGGGDLKRGRGLKGSWPGDSGIASGGGGRGLERRAGIGGGEEPGELGDVGGVWRRGRGLGDEF